MNIALHWQDDDSSSCKSFKVIFSNVKIMLCDGHAARAHQNMLKKLQNKRVFSESNINTYSERYSAVTRVMPFPKKALAELWLIF